MCKRREHEQIAEKHLHSPFEGKPIACGWAFYGIHREHGKGCVIVRLEPRLVSIVYSSNAILHYDAQR